MSNDKILLLSDDNRVFRVGTGERYENPIMTSATNPSGTVKGSSQQSSSFSAWRAFNGVTANINSGWRTGSTTNQWISYTFPQKKLITSYTIFNGGTGANELPKHFKLEGSNNEEDWELLDEREFSSDDWSKEEWSTFSFKNFKEYSTYRLFCFNNNGSNALCVPEMKFRQFQSSFLELPSASEQSFIEYGIPVSELSEKDFSDFYERKNYINDLPTPLGSGKVFEQPLDKNKVVKGLSLKL